MEGCNDGAALAVFAVMRTGERTRSRQAAVSRAWTWLPGRLRTELRVKGAGRAPHAARPVLRGGVHLLLLIVRGPQGGGSRLGEALLLGDSAPAEVAGHVGDVRLELRRVDRPGQALGEADARSALCPVECQRAYAGRTTFRWRNRESRGRTRSLSSGIRNGRFPGLTRRSGPRDDGGISGGGRSESQTSVRRSRVRAIRIAFRRKKSRAREATSRA